MNKTILAKVSAGVMAATFGFTAGGFTAGGFTAGGFTAGGFTAGGFTAGGFMMASAVAAPQAREARIPFVQYGGIRDWRTANDQEIFIQDSGRRWYRAELMGPCNGLEFANGVRFLPSDSAGTFDRFSWIVANGERCKVQSVVPIRSEPDVPNHPRPRNRS